MLSTLMQTMRLPFLLLPPVCVLMGVAASGQASALWSVDFVLLLVGALMAHISVNMLNEYQDFRSGLDLATERTPFSGGSGGLPSEPAAAPATLAGAVAALALAGLAGVPLAQAHPALWGVGLLGAILIVTYTRQINRMPWLCLIAPGMGFGLLMVTGAAIVAGASSVMEVLACALVVFFLVNNLLLANQFPDIRADRDHGREHLLIRYGERAGIQAYALMTFATAAVLLVAVATGIWPRWALLALLPWGLTLVTLVSLWQLGGDIAQRPQALAMNVMATLLTPLVLALILLLS